MQEQGLESVNLIIFDLDGTLLDTSAGIFESIQYAAGRFGMRDLSASELRSFVGPPLRTSFKRCYGCSDEEAENLTAAFRERYGDGAAFNAVPYEGILELCDELKRRGYTLGVATGKYQPFAKEILVHFGFDEYLDIICGTDIGGRMTKADTIRKCLDAAGLEAEESVLVGDSENDAKGAAEAGVPFIAVTYGFGNRDEMMKWPNAGVVDKPIELMDILDPE